jgi:hypothetical protein
MHILPNKLASPDNGIRDKNEPSRNERNIAESQEDKAAQKKNTSKPTEKQSNPN